MTRFFAGGLDARNAFLAFFPCLSVMTFKKSFLINVLCFLFLLEINISLKITLWDKEPNQSSPQLYGGPGNRSCRQRSAVHTAHRSLAHGQCT
jgi:hypothetical protein